MWRAKKDEHPEIDFISKEEVSRRLKATEARARILTGTLTASARYAHASITDKAAVILKVFG